VLDSGWDLDQVLSQMRLLSTQQLAFHTIPTGRPDLRTPVDGIAVEIDRDAVRAFVLGLIGPGAPAAAPAPTARPSAPSGAPAAPPPTSPAASPSTLPPPSARPVTADDPLTVRPADAPETSTPVPTSEHPVIVAEGVPCVD